MIGPSAQPQKPISLLSTSNISRWLALCTLIAGAVCLMPGPHTAYLLQWPEGWTLPVNTWISEGVGAMLTLLKPAARLLAGLLAFPMNWANALLGASPWPLTIGLVTACGWYLGGLSMALLGFLGLGFVLISGYWDQSMNTLALVFVSVPLALLLGTLTGILANEFPRFKGGVQAVLDVMQTVPTFAYLTPLLFLFGFGPVVGLIASAIYAAPPMARNVILGLERVDPEIREAAIMSGARRIQQLVLIEIPTASRQILVGVNQCLMAALSMVIIAAVIGGFNDIGWEVLLTMRKAQFGQSLLAGLVIVVFAIIIDRMSKQLASGSARHDLKTVWIILAVTLLITAVSFGRVSDTSSYNFLEGLATGIDQGLGTFTAANGTRLDEIKNIAMFYGLLPMRIGLDNAVLPFTWGFQWTSTMSLVLYAVACMLSVLFLLFKRPTISLIILLLSGILETGIAELPWLFVLVGAVALAYRAAGTRLAILVFAAFLAIMVSGLYERSLLSLYLAGAAVLFCALFGGLIGLICSTSSTAWRLVQPVCDMLQTIPLFVFLIPVLMFFQIGEFSAFLAICAYAIVPMIRYTHHGLVSTPEDLVEAATSSGATAWQLMKEVRLPYAAPTILLGLNQTILYAFSMLVIAALIGTTDLGQSIFLALGQADIGMGIAAGAAMAALAFTADRLVQGFAAERRRALGL